MPRKTYFIISFVSIILLIIIIILYNNSDHFSGNINYQDYIKNNPISSAIEVFSENNTLQYIETEQNKPICASIVLWEKEITGSEKVAFAAIDCENVLAKDNELRMTSGFNDKGKLYKLQLKNKIWTVIDYDERILPEGNPTKQWVYDYLKVIPKKNNLDLIFLKAKLVKKAGEAFNIKTSEYAFNFCTKDADCSSIETCFLHNINNGYAGNKCVKKCSAHSECGIGYTCRSQCVKGENQCPRSSVNVCVPDLLNINLPKTNEPL